MCTNCGGVIITWNVRTVLASLPLCQLLDTGLAEVEIIPKMFPKRPVHAGLPFYQVWLLQGLQKGRQNH